MNKESKRGNFFCDICNYKAEMYRELTYHKVLVHNLKVHTCSFCDYMSPNKYKRNVHFKGHLVKRNVLTGVIEEFNKVYTPMTPITDSKVNKFIKSVYFKYNPVKSLLLFCKLCKWSTDKEETCLGHIQTDHSPDCFVSIDTTENRLLHPTGGSNVCKLCRYNSDVKEEILIHLVMNHPFHLLSPHLKRSLESKCIISSSDTYSYNCQLCPFKANSKKSLKLHMTYHGADAPFKCEHCSFAGYNESFVNRHQNTYHTSSGADVSNKSLDSSYTDESMNKSNLSSQLSRWNCPYCEATSYSDRRMFLKHLRVKHNYYISNHKNRFKCLTCSYSFNTERQLKIHIIKFKHSKFDPILSDRLKKLDIFEKTRSQDSSFYIKSVDISNTNEVIFLKCMHCEFKTQHREVLKGHLILNQHHSPDDHEAGLELEKCIEQSTKGSDFQTVDQENFVKYYCCSECNYKTKLSYNLNKHVRTIHSNAHIIIKWLPKDDDNSDFSKEETSDIENDYLTESEINGSKLNSIRNKQKPIKHSYLNHKVYKCSICFKTFTGMSVMLSHRKLHFKHKYNCKHCSFGVSNLKAMKRHELTHLSPGKLESQIDSKLNLSINEKFSKEDPSSSIDLNEWRVRGGKKCEYCPYHCKDHKSFFFHIRLHFNEKAKYKCTQCSYGVNCLGWLNIHTRVHTEAYKLKHYVLRKRNQSGNNNNNNDKTNNVVNNDKTSNSSAKPDQIYLQQNSLQQQQQYQNQTSFQRQELNLEKNMQDEVDDYMENVKIKHQLIHENRLRPTAFPRNSFTESWLVQNVMAYVNKPRNDLPPTPDGVEDLEYRDISKWHCDRCPFTCLSCEILKKHISLHMFKRTFACLYCSYSAPSMFYLLEHGKLHQSPNESILYTQSINTLQNFNHQPDSESMYDSEFYLKMYEFSNDFVLVPPKLFKCSHCPFSSISRDTLAVHLKNHVYEFKHDCAFCTYSSDDLADVKLHIDIHFNLPGNPMSGESKESLDNGKLSFINDIYEKLGLNQIDEECHPEKDFFSKKENKEEMEKTENIGERLTNGKKLQLENASLSVDEPMRSNECEDMKDIEKDKKNSENFKEPSKNIILKSNITSITNEGKMSFELQGQNNANNSSMAENVIKLEGEECMNLDETYPNVTSAPNTDNLHLDTIKSEYPEIPAMCVGDFIKDEPIDDVKDCKVGTNIDDGAGDGGSNGVVNDDNEDEEEDFYDCNLITSCMEVHNNTSKIKNLVYDDNNNSNDNNVTHDDKNVKSCDNSTASNNNSIIKSNNNNNNNNKDLPATVDDNNNNDEIDSAIISSNDNIMNNSIKVIEVNNNKNSDVVNYGITSSNYNKNKGISEGIYNRNNFSYGNDLADFNHENDNVVGNIFTNDQNSCRYCGRYMRSMISLKQHERGHLKSCKYVSIFKAN